MANAETQTENDARLVVESIGIQQDAVDGSENPEQSSSSFSNHLPSPDSSNEQSKMKKEPKEHNSNRKVQMTMEGLNEIMYEISLKKKVKIGIWAEKNIPLIHIREYFM